MSHIINGHTLKIALEGLEKTYKEMRRDDLDFDKVADIIMTHSIGAATSSLASAWIPGVGSTVAVTVSVGFIWSMYFRINSHLGIKLKKNLLKSLASAIAVNLAGYLATILVVGAIVTFIPGLGTITGELLMSLACFALTYVSGIVYLKVLTKLFNAKRDINTMSSDEFQEAAKKVMSGMKVDEVMKEAKSEFKRTKKDGSIGSVKVDKVDDD